MNLQNSSPNLERVTVESCLLTRTVILLRSTCRELLLLLLPKYSRSTCLDPVVWKSPPSVQFDFTVGRLILHFSKRSQDLCKQFSASSVGADRETHPFKITVRQLTDCLQMTHFQSRIGALHNYVLRLLKSFSSSHFGCQAMFAFLSFYFHKIILHKSSRACFVYHP